MNLRNILGLSTDLKIGERITIGVPIAKYVGPIKQRQGSDMKGSSIDVNGLEERDIRGFIRLKGYRGTFRVIYETDGWDGLYHVQLIREDVPEDYEGKIPKIKQFS